MIKANELARVKTSGEDVYVLAIKPSVDNAPNLVTVRRPTVGKNGIIHIVEDFTIGELETSSENRARTMSEQLEIQKLMGLMKPGGQAPASFGESFANREVQ